MSVGSPIKLVRDRVSEVDTSEGITYRQVRDRAEHVKLLREKMGEEAVEYLVTPSLAELVDAAQALRNLAAVDLGVTWEEVEAARIAKYQERGGFLQGTVMVTVEP